MEILCAPVRLVGQVLGSVAILQGPRHRAHGKAEPASCTVCSNVGLMSLRVESDGLVAGVKAGHVALAAINAKIIIYYRKLLLF